MNKRNQIEDKTEHSTFHADTRAPTAGPQRQEPRKTTESEGKRKEPGLRGDQKRLTNVATGELSPHLQQSLANLQWRQQGNKTPHFRKFVVPGIFGAKGVVLECCLIVREDHSSSEQQLRIICHNGTYRASSFFCVSGSTSRSLTDSTARSIMTCILLSASSMFFLAHGTGDGESKAVNVSGHTKQDTDILLAERRFALSCCLPSVSTQRVKNACAKSIWLQQRAAVGYWPLLNAVDHY